MIGQRLGPYEVLAKLGEGGMGQVYKARDTRLDRLVAIKIVAGGIDDATALQTDRGRADRRRAAASHRSRDHRRHDRIHGAGTGAWRAVDARSDLFSFGVVLYEMATGRSPFVGTTTALTFDAILNRQPPAARSGNPAIPPALDTIVARLLAEDPAARPASARAVRDELLTLQDDSRRDRSSGASRIVPSLAVLPFTNLSPEPENEYIADGITEEIINTLAQIKGLQVAARTSSFSFKGKTPDLADVAAKLHVAHVVTGSVRKAGPRLRITVQLVNAHDGFPIWSERYDREAVDIFEIQDEIAAAIAQKLRVTLTAQDEPIAKRPTDNLEAYELESIAAAKRPSGSSAPIASETPPLRCGPTGHGSTMIGRSTTFFAEWA